MKHHKDLTTEEQISYRQWARDNYVPFTPIDGTWHPEVQFECAFINKITPLKNLSEVSSQQTSKSPKPGNVSSS
tara:strand:+ start:248 stop:469 length:222 start_codon:yes stop_codon:yes gene_type:complete